MTSAAMTVRVDERLRKRLNKLSETTHRSKSFLATEAINEYLKVQEWQIQEIKKGITEMNAGQCTDHNNIMKHWEKKRANLLGKRRQTKFKSH